MNMRKILHPLLKTIISKQPMPEIVALNEPPKLSGNVIYVINHSCKYDGPVTGLCIPEHFYYFIGKQRLEIVDRIFFFLNGVIYVDRMDKNHRKQIKGKVEKLLRRKSLLICPEGTWNYLPSTPLLPLYWGCIDFAKDCEVPIVPIALDYEEDKCYVKWGQPLIVPPPMTKADGILQVEEQLATLLWEIWEHKGIYSRKDFDRTWWAIEFNRRVKEYPKLDLIYELGCARKKR